jgi:hypothetical protein
MPIRAPEPQRRQSREVVADRDTSTLADGLEMGQRLSTADRQTVIWLSKASYHEPAAGWLHDEGSHWGDRSR